MQTDTLYDFITGKKVFDVGAEANRQSVEKYLVHGRSFPKENIVVDMPLSLDLKDKTYTTELDLVVLIDGLELMYIKCAAASLDSRVREAVAAARILSPSHQLPFAVVSDGKDALIYDAISGRKFGEGLSAIPDFDFLRKWKEENSLTILPDDRLLRQRLVFYTYDSLNVNVQRGARPS